MLNPRSIRSYTCREGRLTEQQKKCWEILWPKFGVSLEDDGILLNLDELFNRFAPRTLEIGFGDGASLADMAKNFPERDFLGIEVYRRGVAKLLEKIDQWELTNIRIFCADAVEILNHIPNFSLNTIQLFFSDPWPKTRHHKRRLIQRSFVEILANKLCLGGKLHLATDWEDYAVHMMKILSENKQFINVAGERQFSSRPPERPITKYEKIATSENRKSVDLIFNKVL